MNEPHQQEGIRGKWNVGHHLMRPKELTFDPQKVRQVLKKEREKHTEKIKPKTAL